MVEAVVTPARVLVVVEGEATIPSTTIAPTPSLLVEVAVVVEVVTEAAVAEAEVVGVGEEWGMEILLVVWVTQVAAGAEVLRPTGHRMGIPTISNPRQLRETGFGIRRLKKQTR